MEVAWEAVLESSVATLTETIRVAGLAGQKQAAIRGVLSRLLQEFGRLSLDQLHGMDDLEAVEYLIGFQGVGLKTAACVLCFSLRRPILPVDTHVHRIAKRLAWVPATSDATRTHRLLEPLVTPEDRFPLHLQLITLGRTYCTARRPDCSACPLEKGCSRVGVT